ncbi:tyrosine-type recombinase/integrase [Sphingobium sp. RSMS]|uniref:tyrosine-type recombinase/integrase n=1 Tax=Sphingobium sp. RSMS TaxID=520734 RepID=UPI001484F1E8|nr:tyrosine-type recombinase/integrase [Sphingobium sp. RSMS]UXC93090.1 tyrosine-type recombinase/integrase [Sphingobium sp. RSMS]
MARKSKSGLLYVKTTTSKGHRYWYFDTGTLDARGKKVFARLPSISDKAAFGTAYAAMLGHRTRRMNAAGALTLANVIALYRKSQRYTSLAAGSKRIYDIYLSELERMLGMGPANEITRGDIVLMVDKRADQPAAANMLLKVTRAMFKWARSRGHVTADPCTDIDLNDLGEHQPWPDDLLAEALAADDPQVRLAVHLLYFTAQRIGDVVAMKFGDIKEGSLFVRQQKTGKELDIPVHKSLAAELAKSGRQIGPILINDRGKPVSVAFLRGRLQKWAKTRGKEIVPHGLRKNAVMALLEADCTVAQTAAISGQTLQMVEHYAKQRDQKRLAKGAIAKWENGG